MYCQAMRDLAGKLLRKKSLQEASSMTTPLKRSLTTWQLVFYGIAQMAGAGIYVLVGTVIKDEAGPAAVFSFSLCGLACLFTGLCYVEFATLLPRAGSCYTFTYVTLGELPAFVIGWTMLSDLLLAIASVAKSFSSTVDALANGAISNFTSSRMPLPPSKVLDSGPDWLAFGMVLLAAFLTMFGAAMSMALTAVITSVQMALLATIAVACFVLGSPDNWTDFAPHGFGGVMKGATVAIFAFSGFEALANAAEECANPRRSLPTALMASLGVVSGLYLAACLGLSYLVNYRLVDIGSPFVQGFAYTPAPWLRYVAATGTLLATAATKYSSVYVVPRLFYALASDRVIFAFFAVVHPRFGVPLAGLGLGAMLSALAALLLSLDTLANLYSLGTLLSYLAVGVDLFVLRYLHAGRQPTTRSWAPACLEGGSVCPPATIAKTALAIFTLGGVLLGTACSLATPVGRWWGWLLVGLSVVPAVASGFVLCAYQPTPPLHSLRPQQAEADKAAKESNDEEDDDGSGCYECYESPLMPMAPLLAVLVNGALLASLQPLTWVRFLVWTAIGILIYGLYGFSHSKAGRSDEYLPLKENGKGAATSGETVAGDAASVNADLGKAPTDQE